MILFKDIKQNYPVYILDTQEFDIIQGKATQVSFPRLEMNQKTGKTEMVVDVTIEANGKIATYTIPENHSVTYAGHLALATEKPGLASEVEAQKASAEHVSKMMVNASGQQHSWTTNQVKKSMESLGLTIPKHVTYGDAAYLANMYYADLYPDPLKDEASCLRAAYKIANDPDGYDGMIFCRWTADAIGKAIKLDWEKFV